MKDIVKKVLQMIGYVVLRRGVYQDLVGGRDFEARYKVIAPYTMVPRGRTYGLYKAVQYIVENSLQGDVVECGVWRGGQSMFMASLLKDIEGDGRTLWLYDTFLGMSEPTDHDVQANTGTTAKEEWQQAEGESHNEWCYASIEEVKKNMSLTKYPNVRYVQGKVEETIPEKIPDKIALLRLDTDWYESTKHELKHLVPRLVVGGVLVIDDYHFWTGAKRAVDEYMKEHPGVITLLDADGGKFGIKLCQQF